jgi:transposase, IS5 family
LFYGGFCESTQYGQQLFDHWVMEQGGKLIRCIGLERATAMLGLKNLTYNLNRFVFWESQFAAE